MYYFIEKCIFNEDKNNGNYNFYWSRKFPVITSMLNNFWSTSCDDRFKKKNIFNFIIIDQVFFSCLAVKYLLLVLMAETWNSNLGPETDERKCSVHLRNVHYCLSD